MAFWLPPEIWLHVFLFATSVPYTPKLYEIQYHPFHNRPQEQERVTLDLANQTILALSLVCREWNVWAMQFMFETLHLSWYGSQKLRECLQRSVAGVSWGQRTRRLELSVIEHEHPDNPVLPADIFLLCPNIEVLVKCDDDLLPHSMQGVDLARLKRFDWYYAWYRDGDHQFATEDDDASRGQSFLKDVVKNAPNLEYLSLIKRFRGVPRFPLSPSDLVLPVLVTLHLESIGLDVCSEIVTWSFPQLRVLRVDSSFLEYVQLTDRIWDTVRVVELLGDQGPIRYLGRILSALHLCPNATELNYCVEYDAALANGSVVPLIQVVRLHFAPNEGLRWGIEEPKVFDHIYDHFRMLSSPIFPALKRVILCGPWNFIAADERFQLFKMNLSGRGCRLDLESDNEDME
ncbi:hypothetical protein C8R45DRAFT_869791 [Mycena sanguinolenta]|nr:hypothetical protein C8R45DRAFT_869791 [Mycena sanguinolenta]